MPKKTKLELLKDQQELLKAEILKEEQKKKARLEKKASSSKASSSKASSSKASSSKATKPTKTKSDPKGTIFTEGFGRLDKMMAKSISKESYMPKIKSSSKDTGMSAGSKDDKMNILISFDTTGSMYPVLDKVRNEIQSVSKKMFEVFPNLKMGIIAHGDYCDEGSTYVTEQMSLSSDSNLIEQFVKHVRRTYGGDSEECYELVLRKAREYSWEKDAKKILILIGDDLPHTASYPDNKLRINWKDEIEAMNKENIKIYAVQALNRSYATAFYEKISYVTQGTKINLDMFHHIIDLISAVIYQQAGNEYLERFEQELQDKGNYSRSHGQMFDNLFKRKSTYKHSSDLKAVKPGRFQMLDVYGTLTIREYVEDKGLDFKPGKGFYEFTKPEIIQAKKEVVLMHKVTGDLFTGDAAREKIGAPVGEKIKLRPSNLEEYKVFVQSTSYTRKLQDNTAFLYEVA